MGLERRKPRKYLSVYKGKIRHKHGETDTYYDSVSGWLQSVELKQEEYQGEVSMRWYFKLTDKGQVFLLKSGEDTVFANSLMNSLGSADLSGRLRISPYITGEKELTVPYVEQRGQQVSWAIDELPEDPDQRTKLVRRMAIRINEILSETSSERPELEPDAEPEPELKSNTTASERSDVGSRSQPSGTNTEQRYRQADAEPELNIGEPDLPF